MSTVVREPIQVYLTPDERAELDQAARDMGVSRSEVLRRGIPGVRDAREARYAGALRDLAADGYVTPPTTGPGDPPPSAPVACLADILAELADDRGDA